MKKLTRTTKEILLNFRFQYPERYKKYDMFFQEDICFKSQKAIQNGILIYYDLLKDMQFLVDLIRKLEGLKVTTKPSQ